MSIVRTLLPSPAVDYVAIFDDNFNQLFSDAKAIKATIKESAKVMEHPVETGAIITDHRVILPVEIQLSVIIQAEDYASVYSSIRQYYHNSTLLTIQTKSGIYTNQLIQGMPHDEDPELYDTIAIALQLKQVQFVEAENNVTPANASNSTTVDRGTQQTTAPTTAQTTALQDLWGLI